MLEAAAVTTRTFTIPVNVTAFPTKADAAVPTVLLHTRPHLLWLLVSTLTLTTDTSWIQLLVMYDMASVVPKVFRQALLESDCSG